MAKVQRLSELSQSLPFTEYDFYDLYQKTFEGTVLGRMKKVLPLREMADTFGLVNKRQVPKRGAKPYFTPEGKVALVFLKMYTQLSAPKLLEQLNGNIHYQIFCGIRIDPERPLKNYKLIDDIGMELAGKVRVQKLQDVLADAWKPYMKDLDTMYTDATCYESEMRFPTDQKLLWECVKGSYRKQRKHSNAQTRKMTRRLLNLLGKILKEIRRMEREHEGQELLTVKEKSLVGIATKVYRQQRNHFDSGNRRESIPDRIVSLSKPYVRPIVRGKEVKSVEFGAKCNNIMVDGISFIEKLSFNAFNEGTRLRHCVMMHRRLLGVDVKKVGGDAGYAGTDNRDFCKENGIQTSFVKRGWPSQGKKDQDYVRRELARVRATAMEGSFGTQKEHYAMRRIKARKKETEILYIFFGIYTANAVRLAERLLDGREAEAS